MHVNEKLLFLNSWLRNPWQVGAMMPSGRALAERIAQQIDPRGGPVIELGPGTGSFTRAMLARGLPERRLALIETDPAFARLLRARYPAARLYAMDAAQLSQVGPLFGDERAGAVVSGLPLLSLPAGKAMAILQAVFESQLHPEGTFIQFSYGFRFPVPPATMRALGLEVSRRGLVVANLPPAFIYAVRRRCEPYRGRVPERHLRRPLRRLPFGGLIGSQLRHDDAERRRDARAPYRPPQNSIR